MSSSPFVHLHLHSQYSLLDGAIKINPPLMIPQDALREGLEVLQGIARQLP